MRTTGRAFATLARRPAGVLALSALVVVATLAAVGAIPERSSSPTHAADVVAHVRQGISRNEMAQILAHEHGVAAKLPRAKGAPPGLPPTVADSPPMKPDEEFGFAPYWTLDQATTFDVSDLTTIAYFSLGVNADGTIQETGTGWDGYESRPFADLVARAHAAGVRVVLTLSCFSQSALDALTSSPQAAATLARQAVADMEAKHLDGVNLDLEGEGSADQAGLTALAAAVSRAVHAVDPHDQVTMDTYGSSAGDPNGFYDIPALAKVVDGFFVMAYDLNFDAAPSQGSAMTSTEFPDALAAAQYAAVVPPVKVVIGESFYGYEWPTSNGTLGAAATGPPTPVSYAQAVSSGGPVYWDRVTQTAWTSYEQGGQWHEAYFEDPESLYLLSALAHRYGFGTGVWALGMQGGDQRMLAAADGVTPGTGTGPTGPSSTSPSASTKRPALAAGPAASTTKGRSAAARRAGSGAATRSPTTSSSTSTTSTSTTSTTSTSPPPTTTSTSSGSPPPSSTTTTTTGPATTYRYSGVVANHTVTLRKITAGQLPSGTPTLVATLTSFQTDDPSVACLEDTPVPMDVWQYPGSADDVVTARTPGQCVTASFELPAATVPTSAATPAPASAAPTISTPTSSTPPSSTPPSSTPPSSTPPSSTP